MKTIYINGKFYAGRLNGVHRVSDRLVHALDALMGSDAAYRDLDVCLLIPEHRHFSPNVSHMKVKEQARGHTQLWEQGILPFIARDGLLVNFANLAPVMHRHKVTLIHDAQFRISPETYAPHFRIGYRLLVPAIARTSLAVITVSAFSREMLNAFGISAFSQTKVVYNGADHVLESLPDETILTANGLRQRAYALLFGTTDKYKNIEVVLAAFADPALLGVSLVIVGAGRAELAAAGYVVPSQSVFVGAVNDSQLRSLYENALCLLFPSRTEGFGLPPVEAMLCSCPVIAAPAGAISEICQDAILYADVSDSETWVKQIKRLQKDKQLRDAKVQVGLVRAMQFTWYKAGLKVMDILSFLLKP